MTRCKFSKITICITVLSMMICAYLVLKFEQFHTDLDLQPVYINTNYNQNTKTDFVDFLKSPFPYNPVNNPNRRYSRANQDQTVFGLFPKKNGFFIEMGAFDGITFSNTVWLERNYNWTGLLIEANPDLCKEIDNIQRWSWRLCACISEKPNITFIKRGALGSTAGTMHADYVYQFNDDLKVTVPCFRLDQILNALQRHHIDYFSLNVEGGEMSVLNSIKKSLELRIIVVDVWTIEYRVIDAMQKNVVHKSMNNLELIRNYFKEVGGYFEHSQLSNIPFLSDGYGLDVLFINVETWCKDHTHVPSGVEC